MSTPAAPGPTAPLRRLPHPTRDSLPASTAVPALTSASVSVPVSVPRRESA
ncbi:hypothetical protein [Streptomyces sp. MJM1172]|uniref:hypothetical protein n=1 Tax=Streptomyces sp. MJM1172 TaxID=1703926 RepID=UPI001300EA05|nr:hypothetical protein [Streptomyces sp. MJM1172]